MRPRPRRPSPVHLAKLREARAEVDAVMAQLRASPLRSAPPRPPPPPPPRLPRSPDEIAEQLRAQRALIADPAFQPSTWRPEYAALTEPPAG